MTQEEKAEAYDKVREIIAIRFGSNVAEEIFSKFKDSKDEKIRKAIINIFATHKDYEVYFGVSVEDIRVWLEQKPATWKPTEEEMKVLDEVLTYAANHESHYWNDYIFGTLCDIIRQLKKLKA